MNFTIAHIPVLQASEILLHSLPVTQKTFLCKLGVDFNSPIKLIAGVPC